MEEAQNGRVSYNHDDYSPFNFLREALNAILKCLGLESSSKTRENCSEEEKNKFVCHQQSCQDDQSSSSCSDGEKTVPPSTDTDPPANDPPIKDSARRGRTPPRPPVEGGPNPQTNSNPSA